MTTPGPPPPGRPFVRFLLAGALNSAATYLLYLAGLWVLPYGWAYSIAYLAGIGIGFVLSSWFVFRVPLRWRKLLRFPLVYLVQYLLGLGVLALVVERFGLDPRLGPIAVVLVTVPVSFVLTRWVLRDGRGGEVGEEKSG